MIPLLDGSQRDPLAHYINIRTKQHNQNFLGTFLGETGGGKSFAALSIGASVDKDFKIGNVAASAKEMVDFIVSDKAKRGTAIVLDEAGVNYSSRNWMKRENKALGELFQTFRYKNLSLFFTLPNFTFMDIQQRNLAHFTFESPYIDRVRKVGIFKGKFIIHDDFSSKFIRAYPLIRYPNGKLAKAVKMNFRLAHPKLIKLYNKKKLEWNEGLEEKIKKVVVEGRDVDNENKIKRQKNEKDWILKYEMDQRLLKISQRIRENIDDYLVYRGKNKGWVFSSTAIRADYLVKGIEAERLIRYMKRQKDVIEEITKRNEKGADKKWVKKKVKAEELNRPI